MRRVILFDVNETLLDFHYLDPLFETHFGDAGLLPAWFAQMIQITFVGVITGHHVDFTSAQRAAVQVLAARRGIELSTAAVDEIVGAVSELPPHPDVPSGLEALRSAGHRLGTLTNSPPAVVQEQMRRAGLTGHFDMILSAEDAGRLKPAAEAYRYGAAQFGVPTSGVRLVAAHAWDTSGALAAGCAAAFVSRPGAVPSPLGEQPDISGPDILAVAELIIEAER